VIITPPELTQSYWVQGSAFSKSYLEEMALFFSHLLLDVSQDSILSQGEVVLRYVVPNSYGVFKSKLLEDEQRLKKHQLSLHFIPKSVAFVQPLTVEVQGYLNHYVGSQRVSQVQETYRIDFSQKKSQLFLESFRVVKSEQGNLQDANL
jgi:conjugal transfer pilus assembly protein TraE